MKATITGFCTITKTQLALLYFPEQTKKVAMQSFRRLILRHESLNNFLQTRQDFRSCHILTPKLVEIIYQHLGNPSDFAYPRSFDEKRKNLA